jgi:WD40 repeat protein
MSFSSDNKKFLSSSKDKTIKIHDVKTGKLFLNITNSGHMITSAYFYDNDNKIISTSLDSKIHVHGIEGNELDTISTLNISEMLISEKYKLMILCAPILRAVLIYDIDNKQEKNKIIINDTIINIAISRIDKGEKLLINSSNLTPVISLHDLKNCNLIRKFFGHRQERLTTKCYFGGYKEKFIVCGSDTKEIIIWNLNKSLPIKVLKIHSAPVNAIAWPFDEKADFMISVSDDHTLKILGNDNIKSCEYCQGKIYEEKENNGILNKNRNKERDVNLIDDFGGTFHYNFFGFFLYFFIFFLYFYLI